jgi:hypothetical protein
MGWGGRSLLPRVRLLATVLVASPAVAFGQDYDLRDVDRAWVGCWTIHAHDSIPDLARALLIRLDSMPTYRGPPPHFYGTVLEGIQAAETSVRQVSWGTPSRDSLLVTIIGLGGYGWRFERAADSLTGLTYLYYDVIPDETIVGRASARRHACP